MANITFSNQDKRIARPKMTNNPLPPKESIETIAVHTRDPSTDSESPLLLLPSPVILSTMYHHNHYGGSGGSELAYKYPKANPSLFCSIKDRMEL
ncbi:11438_t:CDS:2 [Entrophospora sp. SA101]|nr:11438_t:CDS:2 [Entrophospora sp. SA101]